MKINKLYNDNEIITLESYLEKCGVLNPQEYINLNQGWIDNPFNYYKMTDGINMFMNNYMDLSDTYIICDSDLDGITSTVILYQYMKALNKDWNIEILIHEGEKNVGLQDEKIFQHLKIIHALF